MWGPAGRRRTRRIDDTQFYGNETKLDSLGRQAIGASSNGAERAKVVFPPKNSFLLFFEAARTMLRSKGKQAAGFSLCSPPTLPLVIDELVL